MITKCIANSAILTGTWQRKESDFMQGGTPERRKRRNCVWQTLHISDPKLTLCLYCVGKKAGGFTTTPDWAV